ncbi:hypothetical protein [Actinomadura alba]|uniref:Transcriptional regulator n=1 Tax=Actinomadura alba TaxID=406431 RepID=A0ABR7LW77_9ACTN|nr:hypothetical protein [Actinomadura alba]MBC6469099.1 hypothetical protein [Actinomadura alba]
MSIPTYEGLLASARFFADRALQGYTSGDHRAVLMDAGTLLEHVSKALLITKNPAYLVEMKSGGFEHLLHLTGQGGRATAALHGLIRCRSIRIRRGGRCKNRNRGHGVRWNVAGKQFSKWFAQHALADNHRSKLMQAARKGEGFDTETGLPESTMREQRSVTWFDLACRFVDLKWPHAAAKSRTGIGDKGLTAAGAWRLGFACQSLGLRDEAVSVVMAAESALTVDDSQLEMRGALHLNAAIACGLKEDRVSAREHLAAARAIGARVQDGNAHQTFFGSTNVRITEVSVAVELHDGISPEDVPAEPPAIDSGERRARHLIDLAYGHAQRGADEPAVDRLLEADQIAHEEVRLNPRVRTFVGQLLERERPSFRSKIRTLGQRTGVAGASS